jgi:tetratricopeptide (TPR) repeat protein
VVREEEPPRPSTKLSTAGALPTLSANRGTEPRKLAGLLRNELDWIVMKALEKDRARRYETATGFAADVQRYLAGEAVLAHPPTTAYRLKKFVRRNRGQVLAASAVVAALVAGAAGATWQAVVADRARADLTAKNQELEEATRAALSSRQRAGEREDMALQAIENYRKAVESNPDLLTRPDLKPLRQRLLAAPHDFYRKFKEALDRERTDPSAPPGLDEKLMLANFNLASLNAEWGQATDAVKSYREAVEIMEPVVARANDRRHRRDLASVYNNFGNLYIDLGRYDEARAAHGRALELRQRLNEEQPGEPGPLSDLAFSYHNLGWLDSKDGRSESALAHYGRAVELRQRVADLGPADIWRMHLLAEALGNLGWMEGETGRRAEAQKTLRRSIELLEKCAADSPNAVSYRADLARALTKLGASIAQEESESRLREASREARAAFTRARALGEALVAEAPTVPRFRSDLATTLFLAGHLARKLKEYDEAIALHEKSIRLGEALARDYPDIVQYQNDFANGLTHLGLTLVDAGRPAEALPHFERAAAVYEAVVRKNPADVGTASLVAGTANNRGLALAKLGRHEEAVRAFREAIDRELVCMGRDPKRFQYRHWLSLHYQNLGRSLRALGRKDEAIAVLQARIELHRQSPPEHRDVTVQYDIACDMAQIVPLIGRGKKEAELTDAERAERKQYADRAMEALRRAVADGFYDLPLFRTDEDLGPIRGRDDFKQLMVELEAKVAKPPEKK